MSSDMETGLARRSVLHGIATAAGAARLSPAVLAAVAPALVGKAAYAAEAAAPMPPYTVRLAEYATRLRYEDIPGDVLQRAKDCIADTVGVILFGAQFPWSRTVIAYATANGSGGKSRILGAGGVQVHPPAAALAHGALTHAFEQDNLTAPDSGAHPGASLFSSGLAIAQERGFSGRELLTAFVAGAEVMIRIGTATKRTNEARGFHAPSSVGPFGAAVTTGKLLRFDDRKMTNALGIAGSLSGGLLEFARSGTGAMVKRLHLGRAAEGGVMAATLAADGYEGPTTVLEGPAGFLKAFCNDSDPAALTRGLGEVWASRTILMKRFAAHITAHTPVEAILDLKTANRFTAADVVAIDIAGSRRMATANNIPAPGDILLAQYSIPFCVALALHRNPVDPASFDEASAHDPAILATARQIHMSVADGQDDADVSSTVSVVLKDGRALTRRVTDFKGTPNRPLTPPELHEKYLLLTQRFARDEMEHWFERIMGLERETNLDWLSA
jgi:2-methylcitrate dehydratase PrpD